MSNLENPTTPEEEARQAKIRAQQANWFLGGVLFVIIASTGIALNTALNNNAYFGVSLIVGGVVFWAINKFGK